MLAPSVEVVASYSMPCNVILTRKRIYDWQKYCLWYERVGGRHWVAKLNFMIHLYTRTTLISNESFFLMDDLLPLSWLKRGVTTTFSQGEGRSTLSIVEKLNFILYAHTLRICSLPYPVKWKRTLLVVQKQLNLITFIWC